MRFDALMQVAGPQHGCITRRQALQIMSRRQLGYLVETGVLERVHPATYFVVGMPMSWESSVFAAVSSIAGAALSHRSAARWWGLSFVSSPMVEITASPMTAKRRRDVVVHRSDQLEPYVTHKTGLQVTTVARTLVDVSSFLTAGQLGAVVDQACNKKLVKLDEIRHCLDTMITKGRPRVSSMREVLAVRNTDDERLDSFLERRSLKWIREGGLPEPQTQHRVIAGGSTYRLDLAYVDQKVAVEPDGPHHLLPSVAAYDRKRDADLCLEGWVVFHTSLDTTPAALVSFVRGALRRRS